MSKSHDFLSMSEGCFILGDTCGSSVRKLSSVSRRISGSVSQIGLLMSKRVKYVMPDMCPVAVSARKPEFKTV